ncbi:hypothetical protein J6590_034722 [Homalodisca vitripennis]|nr:hypothetical protein J6590_034722 [Homalodisca vitripennis]
MIVLCNLDIWLIVEAVASGTRGNAGGPHRYGYGPGPIAIEMAATQQNLVAAMGLDKAECRKGPAINGLWGINITGLAGFPGKRFKIKLTS